MNDSILTSTKKLLGITEEYTNFDPDIIIHINSVFMVLNQMGIGPAEGFNIEDETATWDDFISTDEHPELLTVISAVKSYMYLKVRLLFDPPLSSAVKDAMNQTLNELEWRLNFQVESQ